MYKPDNVSVIVFIAGFILGMAILSYILINIFTYSFDVFFAKNFKKFDSRFREKKLLLYVDKKGKYKMIVAEILLNNFSIISKDVREKIIKKFSETNSNVFSQPEGRSISMTIAESNISLILIKEHFNEISQDLINENLKKFIQYGAKRDKEMVSKILLDNFKSFPDELKKEIVSTLLNENSNEISLNLSQVLLKYFLDVPREIRGEMILNFSNSKYLPVLENTIQTILYYFFRIPSYIREQAILNYSRDLEKCNPVYIKEIIEKYGRYIPKEKTEEILKKLQ